MRFSYRTQNTCSQVINMDIDGDVVRNISFEGGCNGNLKAVSRLVEGMTVSEIEEKLTGITCGRKPTSCGDQLAHAVRAAFQAYEAEQAQAQ